MSRVLNSDRMGRFRTLAGSEFQTDVAMGLKRCSPKDFELHLGIFESSSNRSIEETYTVQFSPVQDGIYTLRKAHMHSTLSLRSFPDIAFETVPMFV